MAITNEAGQTRIEIWLDPDGMLNRGWYQQETIYRREDRSVLSRELGPAQNLDEATLAGLIPDQAALVAQLAAASAERDAIREDRDALRAKLIALRGVPAFAPRALIALFSAEDTAAIVAATAGSDELRALYHELSNRAATSDKPIGIDSPTFASALAGLKTALGEERVAALFAALNIDLATGTYIRVLEAGPAAGAGRRGPG